MNPLNSEAVMIGALVRAVLLGIGAFGLELTAAQIAAIMTVVELVIGLFTRSQVTSANTLAAMKPAVLAKAQQTPEPVADVVKRLP